ncbi:polysaccharide deacetylase family protein [Luteimonas sp. BDR2-5]|uniref:polysaccharide deacetylase family protein n=1 Tax=Proluteimonas luteida TaxID=2878685 RepID=UPI001E5684F3|nr:polysaccharide deacetylase family protein [Luteimonas sp. BDR2-5]MCD9028776.1 polysaccharide deacetylase family protein [Luteimonas sp. BDR2-5]
MSPHRPPRRPHLWLPLLLASQLAVVVAWWWLGWRVGLPLLLASHALCLWGVLAPGSRLFGPVLTRLPDGAQGVWLTIDDGPSDDTLPLLDLLDAHGAKATFFLVGARARARPELVREILRRGHGIGNHSQTHPQAVFWALGPARMRREILDCQRTLSGIAGQAPVWFRSVVGHSNPFVHAPLRDAGLARVGWSARGFDAVEADVDRVVSRIAADLAPGAIVLLHEGAGHGRNVGMVAGVLARIQAQGLRAVLPD